MAQDSSGAGVIGWLIGLAVLAVAIYFWKATLVIGGGLLLLGILGWLAYRLLSKSGRAGAAVEKHDYAAALKLLQDTGEQDQLISTLRFKVPFPDNAVKEAFLKAVRELLALQNAAKDEANPYLPAELREELARRTRDSLYSLWPLCHKLALVARSKVGAEAVAAKMSGVITQLEDLARNTETTRNQLAHLTLDASPLEIDDATEQVGAMKWQVAEMQKLDAMLEG
ncbi:hypothetical protein [Haloferula sp. BvORR071]|uniref:hypothetical protein n=1 Tax=Haloferula sp. BvORR071 TaxID=1396141 RepID=UPI0005512BA0|nr:hypothetical protein [Haloferula sp. BvORR071]